MTSETWAGFRFGAVFAFAEADLPVRLPLASWSGSGVLVFDLDLAVGRKLTLFR